jgi:hypothetical protein
MATEHGIVIKIQNSLLLNGPPPSIRSKATSSYVMDPELPDGIFSNQKIQIWVNFGGSCNGNC